MSVQADYIAIKINSNDTKHPIFCKKAIFLKACIKDGTVLPYSKTMTHISIPQNNTHVHHLAISHIDNVYVSTIFNVPKTNWIVGKKVTCALNHPQQTSTLEFTAFIFCITLYKKEWIKMKWFRAHKRYQEKQCYGYITFPDYITIF